MKFGITLISILSFMQLAHANPANLKYGIYTYSDSCGVEVKTDETNNFVSMTFVNHPPGYCHFEDPAEVYTRVGDNEFSRIMQKLEFTDEVIKKQCIPTPRNQTPCGSLSYENGKLIAQVGDVYEITDGFFIKDENSFQVKNTFTLIRNGQVLKQSSSLGDLRTKYSD